MEIPEIKIEQGEVVFEILEVPLKVNGAEVIIKMRKITSGKRRAIIKKYVKTGIKGQETTGDIIDPLGIQLAILSALIIEAPFPSTEKDLEKLPEEVTDYLYNAYEELTKKKPKLED